MINYKQDIAKEAYKLLHENQVIGLGAGSTVLTFIEFVVAHCSFVNTLVFCSSSAVTLAVLQQYKLNTLDLEQITGIDIYFDGCDQFDNQLNALKSGGGIHTLEKIFAGAASEFVLLADYTKQVTKLNTNVPLCIEVVPAALPIVRTALNNFFDCKSFDVRIVKGPAKEPLGLNNIVDVYFNEMPLLEQLNKIKMLPGVVDHSLFYNMAHKAIVGAALGATTISVQY